MRRGRFNQFMVMFSLASTTGFISASGALGMCQNRAIFLRDITRDPNLKRAEKITDDFLNSAGSPPSEQLEATQRFLKEIESTNSLSITERHGSRKYPISKSTVEGSENLGIHFYHRGNDPHVLKVLSFQELENHHTAGSLTPDIERALLKVLRSERNISPDDLNLAFNESRKAAIQLKNAFVAETIGGPKVFGAGVVWNKNAFRFYIDMERLGSARNPISLKAAQLQNYPVFLPPNAPEQIANLQFKALEKRVNPYDPDYMISKSGRIRWMDSGSWQLGMPIQSFAEKFSKTFWNYGVNRIALGDATKLKRLMDQFMRNIKSSKVLSEYEKKVYRESWFKNFGEFTEARNLGAPEVSRKMGEILEKKNTWQGYADFEKYYQALPQYRVSFF